MKGLKDLMYNKYCGVVTPQVCVANLENARDLRSFG